MSDNKAAIALLDEWLNDDSGYDDEAWPILRAAIEENRISDRNRFGDEVELCHPADGTGGACVVTSEGTASSQFGKLDSPSSHADSCVIVPAPERKSWQQLADELFEEYAETWQRLADL